jgi:predicted amidohydrolase
MGKIYRVGSANGGSDIRRAVNIDYRLSRAAAADHVEQTLDILEGLVIRGGEAGCDILTLPEDAMGLAPWEAANWDIAGEMLTAAVECMIARLGTRAAAYGMYLICCSDSYEPDGSIRNTAFLLGRDGREIGRYHKVNLPVHEQLKRPGEGFPVFKTPDMGGLGMLICYDMLFPEAARCLALGGANILFNPTEGGAAFGGSEISHAAFRTRAVENFAYLVVSWGGWGEEEGSLILSPKGEILAEERRPGEIAMADFDPFDGRQERDWANRQEDMRARLFRERRPEAYHRLTEPNPPVLESLPPLIPCPAPDIARIMNRAITVGHGQYAAAEEHLRCGRLAQAAAAFEKIIREYPATWFESMSRQHLAALREKMGEAG